MFTVTTRNCLLADYFALYRKVYAIHAISARYFTLFMRQIYYHHHPAGGMDVCLL